MTRKSTARKTIAIASIIDYVNDQLANSVQGMDFRYGQMLIAENLLHDTGNYQGFRYLLKNEVPAGQLPGMVVLDTFEQTPIEVRFALGTVDPTRIKFFI